MYSDSSISANCLLMAAGEGNSYLMYDCSETGDIVLSVICQESSALQSEYDQGAKHYLADCEYLEEEHRLLDNPFSDLVCSF